MSVLSITAERESVNGVIAFITERYFSRIYMYIKPYCLNRGLTEFDVRSIITDSIMEISNKYYKGSLRFNLIESSERTIRYIIGIARNKAYDLRDENSKYIYFPDMTVFNLTTETPTDNSYFLNKKIQRIKEVIGDKTMRIFELKSKGWTYVEIAEYLGVSESAIYTKISRARSSLKKHFNQSQ